MTPIVVWCTKCGAKPTEPCLTKANKVMGRVHPERAKFANLLETARTEMTEWANTEYHGGPSLLLKAVAQVLSCYPELSVYEIKVRHEPPNSVVITIADTPLTFVWTPS